MSLKRNRGGNCLSYIEGRRLSMNDVVVSDNSFSQRVSNGL
jgi:hypothetical protein